MRVGASLCGRPSSSTADGGEKYGGLKSGPVLNHDCATQRRALFDNDQSCRGDLATHAPSWES